MYIDVSELHTILRLENCEILGRGARWPSANILLRGGKKDGSWKNCWKGRTRFYDPYIKKILNDKEAKLACFLRYLIEITKNDDEDENLVQFRRNINNHINDSNNNSKSNNSVT